METIITNATGKLLRAFQHNEITEHQIYKRLAAIEKNSINAHILDQLSKDELAHYEVFKSYTHETVNYSWIKIFWYVWMARVLGLTFALKLMEKGEGDAQESYSVLAETIPDIKRIMDEEDAHEQKLLGMINEEKLKYVGSIVLGLNDALVELTGSLAGFSLALQKTKIIAAIGLIAGLAAMFSMAAAEYFSQKSEGAEHPFKSSIYTGIAYLMTTIILILPYVFFDNYIVCLSFTLFLAIFVIYIFNYYLSVATDIPFIRRFLEMTIISLGVAAISFGIGYGVKVLFGISL